MSDNLMAREFVDRMASHCSPEDREKLRRSIAPGNDSGETGSKKTPESRRKELFDLYIGRHDMIDDWDLVDVAAPYVVGGYLFDKPRDIVGQVVLPDEEVGGDDRTFAIDDPLAHDGEHFVQTAVGGWVREAGKRDKRKLLTFLDKHAATMPRTALRYAIEHLDKNQRAHYLNLKSAGG